MFIGSGLAGEELPDQKTVPHTVREIGSDRTPTGLQLNLEPAADFINKGSHCGNISRISRLLKK